MHYNTDNLAQEIATLPAHLDAATHRLLECIRDFELGTARERVRVARALGRLPTIDRALRTGSLSYAKVRALTRVATPETEAVLLEMALLATGAQLERLCRGYRAVVEGGRAPTPEKRSVRRRQLPGGMVKLELVLEADEADLVLRAVDRAREVRAEQAASVDVSAETCWPSRTDGMIRLAESFLAGNPVAGNGVSASRSWSIWTRRHLVLTAPWRAPWRMERAFPRKRFAGWPATAAWWQSTTTGRR